MKLLSLLTASLIVSAALALPAQAQILVTPSYLGLESTMPGSASDFTFFGNPSTYPGETLYGGGPQIQPTVLNDVSVSATGGGMYAGDGSYATIIDPANTAYRTGAIFGASPLATVTLGSNPGFNYGDFNLYAMFGNANGVGTTDYTITLTINGVNYTAPVTDRSVSGGGNDAQIEEFNITGLAAGDTFTVESNYLGALSFAQVPEIVVPEPSAWALLCGGLLALALVCRSRARMI